MVKTETTPFPGFPAGMTRMATGTYEGDGNANQVIITNLPFTPRYIHIYIHGYVTEGQAFKISDDPGTNAFNMDLGTPQWIYDADEISFQANGFTVFDGTDKGWNTLNINLQTYSYVIFGV